MHHLKHELKMFTQSPLNCILELECNDGKPTCFIEKKLKTIDYIGPNGLKLHHWLSNICNV